MYTKIMAAVDLDRRETAETVLEAAAKLAALTGAEIHYVSVHDEIAAEGADAFREELAAFAKAEQEARGVKGGWVAVIDEDVDEGLKDAVTRLKPDLVIMGAHQPTWLERFTGPTVRDFVPECQVSVLIVR